MIQKCCCRGRTNVPFLHAERKEEENGPLRLHCTGKFHTENKNGNIFDHIIKDYIRQHQLHISNQLQNWNTLKDQKVIKFYPHLIRYQFQQLLKVYLSLG